MPKCIKIKTKKRQVCTGDLQHEIKLYDRLLNTDNDGNVDYTLTFNNEVFSWAAIETLSKGQDIFNGANLIGVATHIFYIQHIEGLTAEKWVQFDNRNFDVLSVENLDELKEFMALYCNERGTKNDKTNFKGI
jgi:head-tail adaptor